ncbi:putative ribonuclease H-like domain-containing protein, partial [Tanacetum coccineum]
LIHNFPRFKEVLNDGFQNLVMLMRGKTSIELPFDPNMPALEDDSIFDFSRDDEDDGVVADMNNLDTTIQEELKRYSALKDPSWIEAMQEELLQFKLQEVWTLVDLPNGKRAIGSKWVFRNKKDERGIVIRNKARLVAQGYTQEEGIDYDEVFALIEEEVYVCQPLGFEDSNFPDRVYKVEKALHGLNQALRAWYETLSTYLLDNGFHRGKIDKTLFIKRYQVNPKVSHLYAVKRIFRYLKGQPKLCLWYPKDSPFDLVAYTYSDYAGASLDRKSTTGEAEYIAASSCCGQVL